MVGGPSPPSLTPVLIFRRRKLWLLRKYPLVVSSSRMAKQLLGHVTERINGGMWVQQSLYRPSCIFRLPGGKC